MNKKMLVRNKCPMVSETGDQRNKDRKLLYNEEHLFYPLSVTMDLNKKVEASSTNIDEMNTTKNDEEWNTSTHNSQDTNNVRSTTFSHPEKITITDGNTGHVISEISLYNKDTVTLHNIGDKSEHLPPLPNINKNGIVEQRMPSITTTLKDMTIQSQVNKDDDDKKQTSEPRNINTNDQATTSCLQPTMCPLPPLSYNNLSPQGALVWQQLPEKDKALLINITSKQQWESTGNSTIDAINGNQLDSIESTKNFTQKCCQCGPSSGELMQFREIVPHKEMNNNDRSFCGSPYLLSILWQKGQITGVPIFQVMHDSSNECIKYMISNGLSIHEDDYDRILATNQITYALLKLVFLAKKGDVPHAIEFYDVPWF